MGKLSSTTQIHFAFCQVEWGQKMHAWINLSTVGEVAFLLSWAPQARSEAWEVYPLEVYHPDYPSWPCRRRPSDDNDDIFTCWVPFHQDTSGTGRPPLASHLNIRSVEAMLVSTASTSAMIRSDYYHTWRQQECPPCMGQWSNRPEQWCRFPETPLKDSKYLMEEKVFFSKCLAPPPRCSQSDTPLNDAKYQM